MSKKIWFYLFWIVTPILVLIIVLMGLSRCTYYEFSNEDLSEYLGYAEEYNGGYRSPNGVIHDEKTARAIGEGILDSMLAEEGLAKQLSITGVGVYYDEQNQLWLISKRPLLRGGAEVVLSQSTGEIIYAAYTK